MNSIIQNYNESVTASEWIFVGMWSVWTVNVLFGEVFFCFPYYGESCHVTNIIIWYMYCLDTIRKWVFPFQQRRAHFKTRIARLEQLITDLNNEKSAIDSMRTKLTLHMQVIWLVLKFVYHLILSKNLYLYLIPKSFFCNLYCQIRWNFIWARSF